MDRIVLLLAFSVLLFASPLSEWLVNESGPWYLPYLLWMGVIAAAWWCVRRKGHDL